MNNPLARFSETTMRRASTQLILSSFLVASAIAGCTLIAEVDRSKIDDSGAGGESPATGGAPAEGGVGGENVGGETMGGAGGDN